MRLGKYITPSQRRLITLVRQRIVAFANGQKSIQSKSPIFLYEKKNTDTFFGYYDISPFNSKNQLLYIEHPKNSDCVNICVDTLFKHTPQCFASSNAWNWQQGCRLRWYHSSNDVVMFNDYIDEKYVCRVVSIDGQNLKTIDWPIYDINESGIAVSLNFEKLGVLRSGYGYTCSPYIPKGDDEDALIIINVNSNKQIDSVKYSQIARVFGYNGTYEKIYINHISFSPTGNRFLFFWIQIINGYHQASLAVYDLISKSIRVLEDKEKVSHYVWIDDNNILCTSYNDKRHCYYYIYNVETKSKTQFCPNSLKEDGHPSMLNENFILTDTYPDINGFQYLNIVDYRNDKLEQIAKIYSYPVVRGEMRTDLHPRLSASKRIICFDTNVHDKRSLALINLENE